MTALTRQELEQKAETLNSLISILGTDKDGIEACFEDGLCSDYKIKETISKILKDNNFDSSNLHLLDSPEIGKAAREARIPYASHLANYLGKVYPTIDFKAENTSSIEDTTETPEELSESEQVAPSIDAGQASDTAEASETPAPGATASPAETGAPARSALQTSEPEGDIDVSQLLEQNAQAAATAGGGGGGFSLGDPLGIHRLADAVNPMTTLRKYHQKKQHDSPLKHLGYANDNMTRLETLIAGFGVGERAKEKTKAKDRQNINRITKNLGGNISNFKNAYNCATAVGEFSRNPQHKRNIDASYKTSTDNLEGIESQARAKGLTEQAEELKRLQKIMAAFLEFITRLFGRVLGSRSGGSNRPSARPSAQPSAAQPSARLGA